MVGEDRRGSAKVGKKINGRPGKVFSWFRRPAVRRPGWQQRPCVLIDIVEIARYFFLDLVDDNVLNILVVPQLALNQKCIFSWVLGSLGLVH